MATSFPTRPPGRLAGVAIMFTGIAALGVLAGSLSALFGLQEGPEPAPTPDAQGAQPLLWSWPPSKLSCAPWNGA